MTPTRVNGSSRRVRSVIIMAALVAGCKATARPAAAESHFVVADVILSVSNQSRMEVRIYLLAGVTEYALGAVPPRSTRSFSLPGGLGDAQDDLSLEARERREGTGIRSASFSLSHGQQVLWTFDEKGSRTVTKK